MNTKATIVEGVVTVVEGEWGKHVIYETGEDEDPDIIAEIHRYTTRQATASKHTIASSLGGAADLTPFQSANVSRMTFSQPSVISQPSRLIDVENIVDCSLSPFDAAMFATVLENMLRQLKILEACNTATKSRHMQDDMDCLLGVKFGVRDPDDTDELEDVDPRRLTLDKYKVAKVERDRELFTRLITSAHDEIAVSHSFNSLKKGLLRLMAERECMAFMAQEETRHRARHRELSRQLRQQRVLNRSALSETDATIAGLQSAIEDATLNGDIRSRYTRAWQSARDEQHAWRARQAEARPGERVERLKQAGESEHRVHSELESFILDDIEDTLEKIEDWMDKYDRDLEQLDLDLRFKTNDYQNAVSRRRWLEDTIEDHEKAMTAWKTFKEERERERKYREKMHTSARCVQAWWRGLLVRKQLGEFRPLKKHAKGK